MNEEAISGGCVVSDGGLVFRCRTRRRPAGTGSALSASSTAPTRPLPRHLTRGSQPTSRRRWRLFEAYAEALAGVDDLIRVTVLYWAHEADRDRLVGDDGGGVFARRGPDRPNPVSVCTCTVLDVDGRRVRVRGLDAVDGSPLVDLKPALQAER